MALVVFTGGARSGKSSAAQRLAQQRHDDGRRVSVVVFGRDDGSDAEFSARVARHRAERPAEWRTIEAASSTEWLQALEGDDVLLIDCMGTLLGLVMDESFGGEGLGDDGAAERLPAGYAEAVERRFGRLAEAVARRKGDTIVVTNEVGAGVVPTFPAGRLFRDTLATGNRKLVGAADRAYLCVAGRLIALEGLAREAQWPED